MSAPARRWTTPYYGITHCGNFGSGRCWVTVTIFGTLATLDKWDWRKDILVAHPTEDFDSAPAAVAAAEKWMTSVGH